MLERILIHHSAPTLAGLKVANLFCYKGELGDIEQIQATLKNKGIELRILGECKGTLIYVYRRRVLEKLLEKKEHRDFLRSFGHEYFDVDRLLDSFVRKIASSPFPHEIGLLLGYPLEDVKGFIEHGGEGCLCIGHWKVYGDQCRAQNDFLRFKQCTATYVQWYQNGSSLANLAVAF